MIRAALKSTSCGSSKGAISREIVYALADANERVIRYYYENINSKVPLRPDSGL